MNFLSHVNDYIEDMATFTALTKFIPPNISAKQRYLGLTKFLLSENFHVYGNFSTSLPTLIIRCKLKLMLIFACLVVLYNIILTDSARASTVTDANT